MGDVLRPESLSEALRGVAVAYYLVHSLGAGSGFPERDVMAARHFGAAAKNAGVERIIYLGGLGDPGKALSAHLRSRHETGDALRESGVPVTEFRAGVIVGSGSLSFEMIRYLTERVPVMICPRWVYTRIQPIAVRTVLDYLVEALRVPGSAGRTIEIGGADVITYGEMLTFYAEVRGLRRWLVPVPVLTPKLSSYWVHFVTPIPAAIARPLIAGLRNEIIVRDDVARRLFPGIQPLDYRTAVKLALEKLHADKVETAWSDALSTSQPDATPVTLTTHEGMIIEHRQISRRRTGRGDIQSLHRPRWDTRLALHELGLAHPRRLRPPVRRGRSAPRTARRRLGARGRSARLLAGRSRGTKPSDAAARGDESARESLAAVRSKSPGPRRPPTAHPNRFLRAKGTLWDSFTGMRFTQSTA